MTTWTRHAPLLALTLTAALALATVGGCRKPRERANTKEQQRQIDDALLSAQPTPMIPVNALLDGKVRLIGIDLDKREVQPGQQLKVTWYWESLAEAPGGWKIFVHFEGAGRRTTHDHDAVGELFPIARWKPGQIIKDEQTIAVPADFPVGRATLFVGIFEEEAWRERKQNIRMEVKNPAEVKVPVREDGRIEVGSVEIVKTGAATPSQTVYRAAGPIVIDGKLDDPGWSGIPPTRPFVSPSGQPLPPSQRTTARLTWDDDYLYVAFTSPDSDIWNERRGRDAKLWEQDAVEIYLDPGADGRDYVEIQVSPTGEIFDAHFSTQRQPPWEEAAARLTMGGMVARVEAQGSVNQRDDGVQDVSWTAEIRIPWRELPGVDKAPSGETWGMNLYRIGVGGEDFMGSWVAVGGDFHNVGAFGRAVFSTATRGRVERAPAPAPAPSEGGEGAEGGAAPAGGETGGAAPAPETVAPSAPAPGTVAPSAPAPGTTP